MKVIAEFYDPSRAGTLTLFEDGCITLKGLQGQEYARIDEGQVEKLRRLLNQRYNTALVEESAKEAMLASGKNIVDETLGAENVEDPVENDDPDLITFGKDPFQTLFSSTRISTRCHETKSAMVIPDVGCLVNVTTVLGDKMAEALTFVPACTVEMMRDGEGNVVGRKLVLMS